MSFPSKGRFSRLLLVSALGCALTLAVAPGARAAAGNTGRVHFMHAAATDFEQYVRNPNATQRAWMRDKYSRMKTWSTYFDSRLSWYSNAWAYQDAYAIYRGSDTAAEHPEWILKDAAGEKLFIPFGCRGGTCPLYAGDIGSPAFRRAWIAEAREKMDAGYRGLYIDDVNMIWWIGHGSGKSADAIDPRTGRSMTLARWQRYTADFMVEVRAAFPDREIVHNAIWYADDTRDVRRQLDAADFIGLERGFNDGGLTNGTGTWSFRSLLKFIARRHAAGNRILLDADAGPRSERLYGLATYFLVTSGRDLFGNAQHSGPNDWWRGYDVELGDALGPRYLYRGVWRRDFQRGTVLVNEPRERPRTVSLGARMRDLAGTRRRSVTLGPAAGAVLVRDGLNPFDVRGRAARCRPRKAGGDRRARASRTWRARSRCARRAAEAGARRQASRRAQPR